MNVPLFVPLFVSVLTTFDIPDPSLKRQTQTTRTGGSLLENLPSTQISIK